MWGKSAQSVRKRNHCQSLSLCPTAPGLTDKLRTSVLGIPGQLKRSRSAHEQRHSAAREGDRDLDRLWAPLFDFSALD